VARDGQQQDGAGDRRRADPPVHRPHSRRGLLLCLLASCRGFLEVVVLRGREWDRLFGVVIDI
jgi:hypothetical protein